MPALIDPRPQCNSCHRHFGNPPTLDGMYIFCSNYCAIMHSQTRRHYEQASVASHDEESDACRCHRCLNDP